MPKNKTGTGEGMTQKSASVESAEMIKIQGLIKNNDEKILLGLDRPTRNIDSETGEKVVPEIVWLLNDLTDEQIVSVATDIFAHPIYEFDNDIKEDHSHILEDPNEKASALQMKVAILRIVGAPENLVRELTPPNYKVYFSESFKKNIDRINRKRELFAFSHPQEFSPGTQNALQVIKNHGLEPTELFERGDVPAFESWRVSGKLEDNFLLEDALCALAAALEAEPGSIDRAALAQTYNKSEQALANLFSKLNPDVQSLVGERMKKRA